MFGSTAIIKQTIIVLSLCIAALVSAAAHAVVVTGDASCDGISTCRIDNLDPINGTTFSSESFLFTMRDINEIAIFDDGDNFSATVFLFVTNTGASAVSVDFGWRFLDKNMTQTGPAPSTFTNIFDANDGGGNPSQTFLSPFDDFVFNALELSITCATCAADQLEISTNNFYAVEFRGLDGRSSVVPLPAAFWLFGTALIGFIGFSRRRKIA